MRQWLGIEFSAYALGFVMLITIAWKHGNASDAVAFVVWAMAAAFLTRVVAGICRRVIRTRELDRRNRSM
jgi:hypothetical protein